MTSRKIFSVAEKSIHSGWIIFSSSSSPKTFGHVLPSKNPYNQSSIIQTKNILNLVDLLCSHGHDQDLNNYVLSRAMSGTTDFMGRFLSDKMSFLSSQLSVIAKSDSLILFPPQENSWRRRVHSMLMFTRYIQEIWRKLSHRLSRIFNR